VQGRTFAQRVAASLLHTLGLDELIACDVAAYSALVIALVGDAPRRAALRDELAARRGTTPLFDGAAFARDIESLYRRMWELAVTGQAPAHLPAVRTAR
jgi:predicted O-linked N-acetylglucosamine transferase (SPINDLY family)